MVAFKTLQGGVKPEAQVEAKMRRHVRPICRIKQGFRIFGWVNRYYGREFSEHAGRIRNPSLCKQFMGAAALWPEEGSMRNRTFRLYVRDSLHVE